MLASSILHLVFGLFMLINPFGSLAAITTVAGIILLVTEIGNVAESIYLLING